MLLVYVISVCYLVCSLTLPFLWLCSGCVSARIPSGSHVLLQLCPRVMCEERLPADGAAESSDIQYTSLSPGPQHRAGDQF